MTNSIKLYRKLSAFISAGMHKDYGFQVSTLGHEMTHAMDAQDGTFESGNEDDNVYANNFGANLASYTSFGMDYN